MKTKNKLYYKIGEVCRMHDIQPHVLRYWETEFPFLSPSKNKAGQRVYDQRDIQIIHLVKKLLYEEGYTIAGARHRIKQLLSGQRDPNDAFGETQKLLLLNPTEINKIRHQLMEILSAMDNWPI